MKNMKKVYWFLFMFVSCCNVILLQSGIESYLLKKCTHLDEYRYFHQYNQEHFFNEFILSETWQDGSPFYKLTAPKEGIIVQINQKQTEAMVKYLGRTVTFPINGFLQNHANLYLTDLTGDGLHELIYEESMSGVGGNIGTCTVLELTEMKILKLPEPVTTLLGKLQVEPLTENGDELLCKVIDSNHHIYFGRVQGGKKEDVYIPEAGSECYAVELEQASRRLKAYTCFSFNGSENGNYIGDISAYYEYNQQTHSFALNDDYVVTLWNPEIES